MFKQAVDKIRKQLTFPWHWLLVAAASLVFNMAHAADSTKASNGRERLSLDRGWLFHLGDIPMPELKSHGESYANAKAGNAWGAAGTEFDDSDWRNLDLPHDWAVEGPFDPKANVSQGYRPRGVA